MLLALGVYNFERPALIADLYAFSFFYKSASSSTVTSAASHFCPHHSSNLQHVSASVSAVDEESFNHQRTCESSIPFLAPWVPLTSFKDGGIRH